MALLHLAGTWCARHDIKLTVASVDHQLRSASRQDCDFVENACAQKNIPYLRLSWEGAKPVTGIQHAARSARYQLLAQAARASGYEAIVTAHTLNDQAETVLMRLIRGSGLTGLQAMQPVSEKEGLPLLRPFMNFTRAQLRDTLNDAGLSWREDASNDDPRFLRPRLRKLMPALAQEGLNEAQLTKLAKKFARANVALDAAAQDLFNRKSKDGIELASYRAAPEEIRLRVLKIMLASIHAQAYPPADEALEELDAAIMAGVTRRTLGGAIFSAGGRFLRVTQEDDLRKKGHD